MQHKASQLKYTTGEDDLDLTAWHKPGYMYVDPTVQQHLRDKKRHDQVVVEEESGIFGFIIGAGITAVLATYGKRIKRCMVRLSTDLGGLWLNFGPI